MHRQTTRRIKTTIVAIGAALALATVSAGVAVTATAPGSVLANDYDTSPHAVVAPTL
jgi:hypothetical protein